MPVDRQRVAEKTAEAEAQGSDPPAACKGFGGYHRAVWRPGETRAMIPKTIHYCWFGSRSLL